MPALEIHPSADELSAFSLGQIDGNRLSDIENHVAGCPSCQTRAAGAGDDRLVGLLRAVHARGEQRRDTIRDVQGQTLDAHLSPVESETMGLTPLNSPRDADTWEASVPDALAHHERYRLLRLLGQGGMGTVYEAEHRLMQRAVALKVINRAFTANSTAVERFQREVRGAARLSHPNIVQAFDAENVGDTHFLVMEYIAGTTLARLVKERGPLPLVEACEYIRQAALGLQHAHERGMVHRDIKPENLILTEGGTVKVLDFGLASLTAEIRPEGLTAENAVMGTPEYMAPEQAEDARSADIRADVYSLGCTLYYLVTGQAPYPATTPLRKILAHREQPIPSMRELPAGLAAVLRRMLAKQPQQRYQTPGEVAEALTPFTKPQEQKPRRVWPWAVAAAVLLGTAALAAGIVVYRIQTDKGELVITTESDDVEVIVKQGGKIVRIIDTKTDKTITLRSGVYGLELKGGEGLKLDIDRAALTRGEVVLAKIERIKKDSPPVAKEEPKAGTKVELVRRIPVPDAKDRRISTAISKGGKYVALTTPNPPEWGGLVEVYDTATGKVIFQCRGVHPIFIDDGKSLLVVGDRFRVYEAKSGKLLREAKEKWPNYSGLNLAQSGKHMIYNYSGRLVLFDLTLMKDMHTWPIEDLDAPHFSEDGKRVLVRQSKTAPGIVWDIENNQASDDYPGLRGEKLIFSYTGVGETAFAVRGERLVRVDVKTGKVVETLPAFSPATGYVTGAYSLWSRSYLARYERRVRLYQFPFDGKELGEYEFPPEDELPPHAVGNEGFTAVSEDDRYAAVMTTKSLYVLRLVDLPPEIKGKPKPPTLEKVRTIPLTPAAGNRYYDVHVSDNGTYALVTRDHGKGVALDVFEVATGKRLFEVPGYMARFIGGGKEIVVAYQDTLKVYGTGTGKVSREAKVPGFWNMTVAPGGKHLLYGGQVGLTLFDLTAMKPLHSWADRKQPQDRAFTPDGKRCLVRLEKGKPWIFWDVEKNKAVEGFPGWKEMITLLFLFADGESASGDVGELRADGKWVRVGLMSGKIGEGLTGRLHIPNWVGLEFSVDYRCLIVFTAEGEIHQQQVPFDGKDLGVLRLSADEMAAVGEFKRLGISEDNRFAAVLTAKTLTVIRLADLPPAQAKAREVFRQRIPGLENIYVELSPDGSRLLSQHWRGKACVWDVVSGKPLHELEGYPARFTPDGKQVLIHIPTDADGNVLALYDTETGKVIRRFGKYPRGVAPIIPFPGGQRAWVMWPGGSANLDLTTGEQLAAYDHSTDFWGSKEVGDFARKQDGKIKVETVLPGGREVLGRELVDGNAFPVYAVATGQLVRTVPVDFAGDPADYRTSAFYGRTRPPVLALALPDGALIVLDLVTGKQAACFASGIRAPGDPAVSADGRFVACCPLQATGDIVVWRLPDPPTKAKP